MIIYTYIYIYIHIYIYTYIHIISSHHIDPNIFPNSIPKMEHPLPGTGFLVPQDVWTREFTEDRLLVWLWWVENLEGKCPNSWGFCFTPPKQIFVGIDIPNLVGCC